ncbi:hypothetical protein LRR81_06820 [Metabacillus sp. GX 13764]|uniref:hypothetical protein n=1 Tax=Metabacillus kandeliae TaxID=2900151 RepID=UPI001E2B1A26|nr:hypothetical protein [Metabacillus kandeliae]MCD7033944.1 hypothetical protein [Metabacillus kandeliae]
MVIARGVLSGLTGAVLLGIFLKAAEVLASVKVYTLLLNVDFLYPFPLPEWVEFIIHLGTGAGIGAMYSLLVHLFSRRLFFTAALSAFAGLLYFPLSIAAKKEVPAITDGTAILYWAAGHLLFGAAMFAMYNLLFKKTTAS